MQTRSQRIRQHLSISKPYSELVQEKIEVIQFLVNEALESEEDQLTRIRFLSELAAQFSTMAAQEAGKR